MMIKHIFKIIRNESKSNLALWLELAVVSVFLWFIVDNIYVTLSMYYKPLGFDIKHTYMMKLGYLSEASEGYRADYTEEQQIGFIENIMERLTHDPKVEAAAFCMQSAPYEGSWRSTSLYRDTFQVNSLYRYVSPDFFKVYKYQSVNGSTDELVEALKRREWIVTPDIVEALAPDGTNPIGMIVNQNKEDAMKGEGATVGAISKPVRLDDFDDFSSYYAFPMGYNIFKYYASQDIQYFQFPIRVKAEEDKDFRHYFWSQLAPRLKAGNFYPQEITYVPDNKASFQRSQTNELKTKMLLVFFLLVNIFLGVMGVFWFRTQARRQQIGLRMVLGDTPRGVLNKFYIEGLLILVTAMIPSMIVMHVLSRNEMVNVEYMDFTIQRFLIGLAITFGLLCTMIMIGIWLPARKAINMSPAVALAEE
ncbi:ABC transporter permease [Porphyromonas levii]|uniref:ABC transporter permease n=1 Tax=Porphyromonas levii TaxID=28114 RepID=UPI001BADB954|nr:FtsX-like permease family protein [Porphyromonas levii]